MYFHNCKFIDTTEDFGSGSWGVLIARAGKCTRKLKDIDNGAIVYHMENTIFLKL